MNKKGCWGNALESNSAPCCKLRGIHLKINGDGKYITIDFRLFAPSGKIPD